MRGYRRCYQVSNFVDCLISTDHAIVKGIPVFTVSMSDPLPNVPWKRFITQRAIDFNLTRRYVSIVYTEVYEGIKLPAPYVDDCFNYGADTREIYKSKCINNHSDRWLSDDTVVRESDEKYIGYTLGKFNETVVKKCDEKIKKPDCRNRNIYTRTDQIVTFAKENSMRLLQGPSQSRYFKVESKERMNDIDYFCFILGTMGAWLGLSILSLNPLPYITKQRVSANEQQSEAAQCTDPIPNPEIDLIRARFDKNERHLRNIYSIVMELKITQ